MESLEGGQVDGAVECAEVELEKQRLQMKTFFADLALRLLIDCPKTRREDFEHNEFWKSVVREVQKVMQIAPAELGARLRRVAQSKSEPALISFDDTDPGLAAQLADARDLLALVGQAAIGRLFMYRSPESREKFEKLIQKVVPYYDVGLGNILAAVSELHMVKAKMDRLEGHSKYPELSRHAEKLVLEIREHQDDPRGRDSLGRKGIDWTTTMSENGIVFNALRSIVSNRAGTALKEQLSGARFEDINVDGRVSLDEFDDMDWADLRKFLGLQDIAPYRELIESSQHGPLHQFLARQSKRNDRALVVTLVRSVLGDRADLDFDTCIQVVSELHRRLSRFTRQWIRLQRRQDSLTEPQPESRGRRHGTKNIEESDGDEDDVDVPNLLNPQHQRKSAPNGSSTASDDSGVGANDEFADQVPERSDDPDCEETPSLHEGEGSSEFDEDSTEHFDEAGFLSAFLSATCATQLLVWMKKTNLAKVPKGGGADWSEKATVFAAAIDAMYRLAETGGSPASAGRALCDKLSQLSRQSFTNFGYYVFALEADEGRGRYLYEMVVGFAERWRADGRSPTGDLQTFELNYKGHFALTKRDRDDLAKMFERARKECEESEERRRHLLHYLEVNHHG